jgi:hypothetical protein
LHPLALLAALAQSAPAPFEPVQVPLSAEIQFPRLIACELNGDAAEEVLVSGVPGELVVVREDAAGELWLRRVPLPWTAHDMAAGDLDGDGDTDVALSSGNVLFLLENLGGLAFAPARVIADDNCRTVEVADLDGDGLLDLLSSTNYTVKPYRNRGGLHFEPLPPQVALGSNGRFVAGDWNGDGLADLLAIDTAWVQSLLGDGLGAFVGMPKLFVTPFTDDARVADLDGDGALDLVLLGSANPSPYLRGAGDGTFAPAAPLQGPPTSAKDACVADLDDDGRADALLVGGAWRPLLDPAPLAPGPVVALQNSPIQAVAAARLRPGRTRRVVAVTVSEPAGPGALRVNLTHFVVGAEHTPAGLFARAPLDAYLSGPAVDADFDGDGHLDRVYDLGPNDTGPFGTTPLALLRGTPQGWAEKSEALDFTAGLAGAADVDGDGAPDLVSALTHLGPWSVRFGDGAGGFSAPAPFAAGIAFALGGLSATPILPDLDGDGRCDLLQVADGQLTLRLGAGDGTFASAFDVATAGTFVRRALDVDGDGDMDLAVGGGPAGDELWLGDGHGGLVERMLAPALEGSPSTLVGAGDLDGDGAFELITWAGALGQRRLGVHPGLGGAAWAAPRMQRIAAELAQGQVADVDGDGLVDLIALAHQVHPEVWRGDGDGGLAVWSQPSWRTRGLRVHDVDGDGSPELIGDDAILRRP